MSAPQLPVVTIARGCLPARMGRWQESVILRGHLPGYLSMAVLPGGVRKWWQRYAASRDTVAQSVAAYGVVMGTRLVDSRWCRVWVDTATDNRVQLVIDYNV